MSAATPLYIARTSQSRVAKRLNRSASLVSYVLRAKYPRDMEAVEEVVRGVFMDCTVLCPALGEISTAACRDWMLKARSFSNENSERVRMYRTCRSCPRAKKEAVS
ncbi:hypothetical protein [Pseudogemmobacter sonorensis]|uniref:hypothetical protein n=1 Tax=Pseudogemmobacter sonorensis TaxID=2989681 RepID=UPI0036B597C3